VYDDAYIRIRFQSGKNSAGVPGEKPLKHRRKPTTQIYELDLNK
jgi:hypothetical protein